MTRELTIPCQTCNGDGFVSFEDRHVENRTESCRTCGGRGVVPAATGQTPETSAAPDGGLHDRWRLSDETRAQLDEIDRHTVVEPRTVNTGVPNTGSFHSGD